MGNKYSLLNGNTKSDKLYNINIVSSDVSYIYDNKGNRYTDLNSGLWNVSLGHDKDWSDRVRIGFNEVLKMNLPYLDISSYEHDLYNETAIKLLNFVDEKIYDTVLYTNSGSESLEVSYKLIHSLKPYKKILSFSDSYHGTFYGGMALSGLTKDYVASHQPDYRNNINISLPLNEEENKIFFESLNLMKGSIGAFVIEPVIASGGIKFTQHEFYDELLKYCEDNNIISIFDEVATGFYKTGNRFFIENLKRKPDMLCLSKGINNGVLPAGAVLIKKELLNGLESTKVEHYSTQNGNLLCIRSIYDTLDYYMENDEILIDNVNAVEKTVRYISSLYNIKTRVIGSMIAIPVKNNDVLNKLMIKLQQKGILMFCFDTNNECGLTLIPNININNNEFEKVFKYIIKSVKKYE